jgi:hypothetical protein
MHRAKIFIAATIAGAISFAVLSETNIVLAFVIGAGVGAGTTLFFFVYPKHLGYAEHKSLRDR